MASHQFSSMPRPRIIEQQLPDGWEMGLDKTLGWPFFIDHNTRNTTWTDPRLFMMGKHQFPYASYGYCEPERHVEVPIRYRTRPESMPTDDMHHWGSAANTGNNSRMNRQPGAAFQQHRQRSGLVPRKCGDIWEIPVQYLGQNNVPTTSQQSRRSPQNQSPECHPRNQSPESHPRNQSPECHPRNQSPECHPRSQSPECHPRGQSPECHPQNQSPERHPQNQSPERHPRGPVPIQVVHEVSVPETRTSPSPSRASSEPATGISNSPCASTGPCVSSETDIQVAQQPHPEDHCSYEPTPDDNKPEFEQTAQQMPSAPQQQDQPPHSDKSQEETAYEIINEIMSEVKSFEEQVSSFKGVKKDKEYRYLEEMFIRSLLKLDNVESGSVEAIRQARKQAVRYIEAAINLLELKALASEASSSATCSLDSHLKEEEISQSASSNECAASSH